MLEHSIKWYAVLTIEQCQKARDAKDPRFDGKFFVLVKTTGIFCRPVCKVRAPLENNVDYTHSALDALRLGYRPCLRCRPESAPQSHAWLGIQTTVKRAANMLSTQHHRSIQDIAERLGISTRYLHKLMTTHFQLQPKQFRIYQQVLLAKKLLQSSTMNIEQVAQGAGFGSARQLQYHFKKIVSLTPTQTRTSQARRPSVADTLISKDADMPKLQSVCITLPYQGEYDWPLIRAFFQKRIIKNNEHISDNCFTKTLNISDTAVRVAMHHHAKTHSFDVRFDATALIHTAEIIKQVSTILDLYANPFAVFDAIKSTGLHEKHVNFGLRIPGIASRFEAGIRAILGQQVSVQAAITQVNRLQQGLCGESEQLLSALHIVNSDLGFLKLPEARKNALRNFAQLKLENEHADFDRWLDIKGIGPWTVNYVKLRATDDTDVWLDTDLIIKQQIQALSDAGIALNHRQAAPWRSYLTLSLWNLA